MRRIVSLWLPSLATDRLTRRGAAHAAWRDRPLACVAAQQGGLRVTAASAAAQAGGVGLGQPVADARALVPELRTVPAAPEDDAATLRAIADWCGRWTPWTAADGIEPGGGVWLDVSGCAHLFGGEQALLDAVVARLEHLGFAAFAAIADTPGAAWAAARFGRDAGARTAIIPDGAARQLLAGLPIAALRLPAAVRDLLNRLGLRRIGDLYGLPRAPLAARFGDVVALRLDQLLGLVDEPISPIRPTPAQHVRIDFAEPIARTEDVAAALDQLLAALGARLAHADLGARRLELRFYRVDGTVARLAVGTAQPVRDAGHLARLFARGLDGLNAGFGFEAATLAAAVAEPFAGVQADLADRRHDRAGAGLGLLVDRLANRLGRGAVARLAAVGSHVPELAVRPAAPLGKPLRSTWPVPPRPARLLATPERVAAEDAAGFGPPVSFRWRNEAVQVTRAEGPERISAEWWHAATPPPPSALRDYWRVEDGNGRRFWLYRDGASGPWFVQGMFG